ncbi:MAG: tyrosine-type recombinase/integrase [Candidatus Krumholzibacteriia bacterium]
MTSTLGSLVRSFFEDHLTVQKGLRPASVRSYADALRLFLGFVCADARRPITKLAIQDLTCQRVVSFLAHLEKARGNHIRTRNQRLAAMQTFFEYAATRIPEMLDTCQRVASIPIKRTPPPETYFLEPEEVSAILRRLPCRGRHAVRDRTLFLFLYNTGARAQEVADLRVGDLELDTQPRVRLHGKGDKWRSCPLWSETVNLLRMLIAEQPESPGQPVFCSRPGAGLTRFGIYKIVRRHARDFDVPGTRQRRVTPHLFRHTAAVHLLEAGVEINVIRGWLGHVDLQTTNRYAELSLRAKENALRACEPTFSSSAALHHRRVWKDDASLLAWLSSL